MKQSSRSYIAFTRTERFGLVALMAVVVLLIAVRMAIPYFTHTTVSTVEEKRQVAAWETFKRSQPPAQPMPPGKDSLQDYVDVSDGNEAPVPNLVNINTADSATLVRLKGIGPAMAAKILARRTRAGRFTNVEQLLELQAIPAVTFKMLKPHLSVDTL